MFHDACTSPVPTSTYATLSFENETNRRQQCLHRQASKACGTRYPGKNQFYENSAVHVFHPGVHFCAGIKISLGGFRHAQTISYERPVSNLVSLPRARGFASAAFSGRIGPLWSPGNTGLCAATMSGRGISVDTGILGLCR